MSIRGKRFPGSSRLNRPADFNEIFKSSIRSVDSRFVVLAIKNEQDSARLGLAISKKKVNLSVSRNRIKRLIRESFRIHQQQLSGLDIVVIANKNIENQENKILNQSLIEHWDRIRKCAR